MSEAMTMPMPNRVLTMTLGLLGCGLLSSGLVGCGLEPIDEGGEGGEDAIPAEVQAAFDQSCATSSACHATGSALVVLEAPESAGILASQSTAGGAFVTLGSIEESYIAQKILGGPNISGGTMPPSEQSPNDDTNTALIVGWIAGVDLEGEGAGTTGDGDGDPDPGPTCYVSEVPELPSFSVDIWPVFEARCAVAGCHAEFTPPVMADALSTYDNLVGVNALLSDLAYIEPNSPDASYLWHKLVGTQTSAAAMGGGGTMPANNDELCAIEFQAIYTWIATGAAP